MARVEVKVGIVQRTLENGTCVAEAIMLPDDPLDYDPVYFSDTVRRSRTAALKLAHNRLEGSDPGKLQGVSIPESLQIIPIEVEIEPPKRSPAWVGPVVLTFDTVQWMHSESYAVAYVPALRIYVIADSMESMKKRLLAHTRFALFRNELAKSLWDLVKLQRTATTKADVIVLVINIASPKNRAQRQEKDEEEDEQTTLKKIATNLSSASQPPAYHVEKEVLQVAEALQGKRAGSVLLVGPSGVGKTAIVHELVRNRATLDLHHRTFYATSGSRLIAGMGGFGMWQERCRTICKEAKELQAVLHVGGLIELMEVGKSMYNQNGIASFLRPYLLKGDLQIIAECTPEEITAIEREDPHLLQAFHRVDVHEPGQQTARDILRQVALQLPPSQPSPIREDALDLIDRLHRRYATYSAYPGRPIRFLRNLLKDTPMDRAANARDVLRAFTRETGIPETILDEDAAFDLAATRMWFEERIMGQSEAIEQVVDLLAVIKSRLSRPRKPLASFLFAGPTGVGKTETAKALAEFLFGGKDRMFRFDMSEFSDPYGAARLISGTAEGEGLLLDEFEKAHPSTYDLLLQVLGEGRLSDQKGRVADFCNSIIIMTSNLGAGSYQQSSLGFANTTDLRGQAREHFSGEVRKFLRPEMFNRIDAIIAFSPLDRETVNAIARRELAAVQKRDGLQYRGAAITFTDALAVFITDQGFDPRDGARPIKRAIEDTVVTPLACRMNAYADDVHLRGEVKTQDDAVHIHLTGPAESDSDDTVQPKGSSSLQELGEACADLRRKAYRLKSCGSIIHIENELFRAERMEKTFMRRLRQRPKSVIPPPELKQITSLRELLQEAESLYARANGLETDFLVGFYEKQPQDDQAIRDSCNALMEDLDAFLLKLYFREFERPDKAVLGIFGSDTEWIRTLVSAYVRTMMDRPGFTVSAEQVVVSHDARQGKRILTRSRIPDLPKYLRSPPTSFAGIVLAVEADMAYPLLLEEAGVHVFKNKEKSFRCLVDVEDAVAADYTPPPGVERLAGYNSLPVRRTYNCDNDRITEPSSGKQYPFNRYRLHEYFERTFREKLKTKARALIAWCSET